ncbi:AEC family transporter [soil metagenome]
MTGVLIGFAIVGFVILIGYVIARIGLLGDNAGYVLSRLAFFVLLPCLLFTVLADADIHVLFSSLLAVSAISAVLAAVLYLMVIRFFGRRTLAERVVGALAASYTNANNIGLPVAVYVIGSASYVAPVILFQLVVLAPIALTLLDISTSGRASFRRIATGPLRNPLLIASALGVILAVSGVTLPVPVMQPFSFIGAAAVPVVLLSFGMSLHGRRALQPGAERTDVVVASVIKSAVMPIIAFLLGRVLFGLHGTHLFAVIVLAALPTAQNVFNYAQRYSTSETLARDAVLLTTVAAVPVILIVAALLGG